MNRPGLLFVFFILVSGLTRSQELNCIVSINTEQLPGTNKDIFTTLETSIREFMNNTVWTNNVFELNERIECNLLFNISQEVTTGVYKGTLNVQARRPVFGSSYNTVLLNYMDQDIQFKYTEYDPLDFSETSHISNLTSILAYYAYLVLGLDYDSFSSKGGTPYFQKVEKIVMNAQSAGDPGWKAFESRERSNRYWLINNIMDEGFQPLREFNYSYHRLGLDVLDNSIDRGRLVIEESIIELEKLYNAKPDPFMHYLRVVIDSKADEIVQIFSQAPEANKSRVYNVMVKLDPSNVTKYAPLRTA
jgi:hypothetical protein